MENKNTKKVKENEKIEVKKANRQFENNRQSGVSDLIATLREEIPFRLSGITGLIKSPRINLKEDSHEYTIIAEVPGIEKKHMRVEADENSLTIEYPQREEKGPKWLKKEFQTGNFCRTVALPMPVDSDKARAEYKKGLLYVTLPKKDMEEKKTKVNIKSEK
ncbi:MAG: Hsp20/alpha crystallin family protein [Elusimicrobiota bacterium]